MATSRTLDIRRWQAIMVTTDFLVAAAAGVLAVTTRFGDTHATVQGLSYVFIATLLPVIWTATISVGGGYDARFLTSGPDMFKRVFNAGVGVMAGAAILSYILRADLSREFLILAVPAMTFGTLGTRYVLRQLLHRRVAAGESVHRVLVIGARYEVLHLKKHMDRAPQAGFKVVGTLYLEGSPDEIGGEDELAAIPSMVHELEADTIAVAGTTALGPGELRRLAWSLEGEDITLIVAPGVTDFAGPRICIRPVSGLPLLYIEEPEFSGVKRALKHGLDRVVALCGLIAISPLLALVALAIKLADGGPILFRQIRVGQHGEEFQMLKFRTMVPDAEKHLDKLHQMNEHDGVLFKIRQDPRVTRIGRFLRRHSIDELPQLWNVVRGDMSLVGPRPPLPSEVARYGDDAKRRLLVRPGLTGLWQISGRADLSWEEAVRLDLQYTENWSVAMDAMVIWKTLAVVFRGTGGY